MSMILKMKVTMRETMMKVKLFRIRVKLSKRMTPTIAVMVQTASVLLSTNKVLTAMTAIPIPMIMTIKENPM